MKKSSSKMIDVDQYIAQCDPHWQPVLQKLRQTIQRVAPKASEAIKYQMPTYSWNENLVHFALCKGHIGFYPTPSAIIAFASELSEYETSKGAIQFPLDKKLPLTLIRKIVKFRVAEAEGKRAKK